ncbi:MAG: transglycosylase SLT domain-containing protein [Deltaproteobacteria bacterium]|nr:transglycosylase SLT domain-containing protein [Deltaproteobacteria bacterium]
MKPKGKRHHTTTLLSFLFIALIIMILLPSAGLADYGLLKEIIIHYNKEALEKSLQDDSYRGEEGILRMRPEIAESLGMIVLMDPDYLEAKQLFEKAEDSLKKAKEILVITEKDKTTEEYAQIVADLVLQYKKDLVTAQEKLKTYHSRLNLNPQLDERLNDEISEKVMTLILEQSFQKIDYGFRDALAYFFNICQGVENETEPLTTENVRFVNSVYNAFTEQASEQVLKTFILGQGNNHSKQDESHEHDWKRALCEEASPFLQTLDEAFQKYGRQIYEMDPLIFVALIRQESNFNPDAISYVGAAGLTQIMPKTAKSMGMQKVHMPDYLEDAESLLRREQKIRQEAIRTLLRINEENKLQNAKQSIILMRMSLVLGKKRKRLYDKYRNELLALRADSRLQPSEAIEYGLKYFARLMKNQEGDISLALASYNAGPSRISTYNGIPPFEETVTFRNKVLRYYRAYLERTKDPIKTTQNRYP